MRILIVGATGNIGRAVVAALSRKGVAPPWVAETLATGTVIEPVA